MNYKIIKIPKEMFYCTWQGVQKRNMEIELCMLSQGYGEILQKYIINSYHKQAKGYWELLIKLILSEEQVGDDYK